MRLKPELIYPHICSFSGKYSASAGCNVQGAKCRTLLRLSTTTIQGYCSMVDLCIWLLLENNNHTLLCVTIKHTKNKFLSSMPMLRVQPTDWHFFSARPCAAPVIINITYNLHWVVKYVGFQVSLKFTNFDINTTIFLNLIPNNDSFVPQKHD